MDRIVNKAQENVNRFTSAYNNLNFNYGDIVSFAKIKKLEKSQQKLINYQFNGLDHLFVKNFSGTYWSYDQCVWIDAISNIARSDEFRDTPLYNIIMSSLMFAMAYCTQSTGHYAMYRDVKETNMKDILVYRRKEILPLFKQKFESLKEFYKEDINTEFNHNFTRLDFSILLDEIEENSIIYADPPYQFVHYSRFYHALETLAKYDYPEIKHKGRYRTDRHQSPFCIKTKVKSAFTDMFIKTYQKNSTLVLSYSDTGMISLSELLELANSIFVGYNVDIKEMDYKHSTMGRQGDKSRDVKEVLIVCSAN